MLLLLLLNLLLTTTALHADEAGLTDFLIHTPGHGRYGIRYAKPTSYNDEIVWVTSESSNDGDDVSCFVAARNVSDGSVMWRTNACSSGYLLATLVQDGMVYTLDSGGILRSWRIGEGLQWEYDLLSDGKEPLRLVEGQDSLGVVHRVGNEEGLTLFRSGERISGEGVGFLAMQLLQGAKVKSTTNGRIINLISLKDSSGILTGYISDEDYMTLSSMAYTEIDADFKVVNSVSLKLSGDVTNLSLIPSSLQTFTDKEKVYVMGIEVESSKMAVANFDTKTGKGSGMIVSCGSLYPQMKRFESIDVEGSSDSGQIVRVSGTVGSSNDSHRVESLVVVGEDTEGGIAFEKISSSDVEHEALAYCPDMNVALSAVTPKDGATMVSAFETFLGQLKWAPRGVKGETLLISPSQGGVSGGLVEGAHLVECTTDYMTVVFTARGGMTIALRLDKTDSSLVLNQLWSSEEALASISSAVFLDETHATAISSDGSVNADKEEKNALNNLQFSRRMQSQLSSLKSFFLGGGIFSSLASMALMSEEKKEERNVHFGFAKLSVVLSESMHRLIALDTAKKGKVVWSMNLHPEGVMHKIVHGGQSLSLNNPHGYGGVHDHELLVLSHVPDKSFIEWKCFDGMTGKVFSNDVVKVSSEVAQIVPLRSTVHHASHESASCRQVALVVHEDDTVSLIPDTDRSYLTLDEVISASGKAGFFVHTIGKETGEFRALRVTRKSESTLEPGSNPFELATVGTALFDPSLEKIVNIAYPQRGEVIQSPSTILGDDSLLLKYLNPHLVVVVTEATKSFLSATSPETEGNDSEEHSFYKALSSTDSALSGQKRKPLGASKPGEAPPAAVNTITPSLFVTLVDSVSGQILHRVSHAHATEADVNDEVPTNVPVIVSENWVVYTFFNQRTRRTDVGILTLHEGMIDKNGLTAFNSPEQELTFSSLESPKPIVLSKTFGLAKAITALGVTVTKAGISSKQFLFATGNDQVISMDRRMMDPRRPSGELKPSEKAEGLVKYAPLLPIIPLRTPSHVYEVSNVQSISSTTANVESQSLILAYGGPDVFFTRLAPSKGFDLLPDDFNRGLLAVVVLGMVAVLVWIQGMNQKKMVSSAWA